MSLQYDEAVTLNYAARGPAYILSTYKDGSNNHLLHSLLVEASISLFGWSELAIRLPALLGGIATIAGAALLAKRLTARWRAAVFAAGLLTAVPLTADYFILARGYSLSLAAVVGLMLLIERALRGRRVGWATGVVGGGLVAASIVAVPTALLALAALGVATVVVWWRSRLTPPGKGPLIVGLIVGAAVTLGLYARILGAVVTTLFSLAGTEVGESSSKIVQLLESLTGNAWTGTVWVILAMWWATRDAYGLMRPPAGAIDPLPPCLAVTFLLYLLALPMGYARNHVFLVLLLVLLTIRAVERLAPRWRHIGEGLILAAAAGMLVHVPPISPAADRSVVAFSGLRPTIDLLAQSAQPPCLATEEQFLFPLAFYAARGMVLIRRECPYVLLKWPPHAASVELSKRMYPDKLDQYGVALLDRLDQNPLEQAKLDRAVAWIRHEVH